MGTILNSLDDEAYKKMCPVLKIAEGQQLEHKIYIQILELNPTPEIIKKLSDAIDEWNQKYITEQEQENNKMTITIKNAIYRHKKRDEFPNQTRIKLLGSVRNYVSNNQDEVIREMHSDAEWLKNKGFTVCREKIVTTNLTDINTEDYPLKYFDSVFIFQNNENKKGLGTKITGENLASLNTIYNHFIDTHNVYILREWYDNTETDKEETIFVVRYRNIKLESVQSKTTRINDCVSGNSDFVVKEYQIQYCWYDSYPEMDVGLLEPTLEYITKLGYLRNMEY